MTDAALQRTNMVESQIRPSDVTDRRILRAMQDVRREAHVPAAMRELAYMDGAVPLETGGSRLGAARSLMSPRVFAKLLQLLDVTADDKVLIAGAGGGYSAAVVATFSRCVVALESDDKLAAAAKASLAGTANVTVLTGPLAAGVAVEAPFDAILVEGMIFERPETLLGQLKPGGRLAAILNDGRVGCASVWRRVGDHFGQTSAFEASAGPLPGFEPARAFIL